ncbi:MAG: hypothetical protein RLZZ342_686 [Candidatus Parcubacteria bacterium]|jgi:hypothetical protein
MAPLENLHDLLRKHWGADFLRNPHYEEVKTFHDKAIKNGRAPFLVRADVLDRLKNSDYQGQRKW